MTLRKCCDAAIAFKSIMKIKACQAAILWYNRGVSTLPTIEVLPMSYRFPLTRLILLITLLAGLSACAPAPTPIPAPTIDPAAIHTQAAATIYARQTAEVTPTFTPTVEPTATSTPESTATPLPTATVGTPEPTATQQIVGDAAKFTGTAPHSGVQIEPNQTYNLEFDFLNVGTTTWNANYRLVWVGGEQFTSVVSIPLGMEVPPGKKGVFVLGTFGSEEMKNHYTRWQLYNDKGIAVAGGIGDFWYTPV